MMEKLAPNTFAYDWDNVGLQIGSYNQDVKRVMVTLDVLESVVDEAIDQDVELIISHHPLLFQSMKQIDTDTPKGRMLQKLIQHNITVYSSHTNLDIAYGGVNDILCEKIGIENTKNLVQTKKEKLYKVVIYVPESHRKDVMNAINNTGAGHIGNYSHCTFQTKGQGTFKPLEGTSPYIGKQGELEFVDEVKIESIAEEGILNKVVKSMVDAHPYEEVAYDIFPMANEGQDYGLGRIGTLQKKINVKDLCNHMKEVLKLKSVRVTGDLDKEVKRIAVLGGSGEKYWSRAKQKGADVYITGDMTFHAAQEAWQHGLVVIDPGHYSEYVMKSAVKRYLDYELKSTDVDVIESVSNTDPFKTI
ncbi:Nif3-like dinuclear metal center hexameric protein [Virgibacillus oceani]